MPAPRPLLSVRRLSIRHRQRARPWSRAVEVPAIHDLHFDLQPGETLCVAGAPGCGKSSLARVLAGDGKPASGQILLDDEDAAALPAKTLRARVALVSADALAGLPPKLTATTAVQQVLPAPDGEAAAAALLRAGLPAERHGLALRALDAPDRLRVALARAIAIRPQVLVCDDPWTVLPADARAGFTRILMALCADPEVALILTARDLRELRPFDSRVLVLHDGHLMEQGPCDLLCTQPAHPCTQALLGSVPAAAAGLPPPPVADDSRPEGGCSFRLRCPLADSVCVQRVPILRRTPAGNYSACHFAATEESPMIARTA